MAARVRLQPELLGRERVSYEINVASFIMGLEVRPAFFGMEGGSPIDKSCLLDQGSTLITNAMSPRVVIKLNKEKENCMY